VTVPAARRGCPPGPARLPAPHEQTPPGTIHGPGNCQCCRELAYAYVEANPRHPAGFPPGKDEWWVVVLPAPLTGNAVPVGPHDEWEARDRAGHYADLGLGLAAKLLRVVEEFPAKDEW
jgi:hypothetical protein